MNRNNFDDNYNLVYIVTQFNLIFNFFQYLNTYNKSNVLLVERSSCASCVVVVNEFSSSSKVPRKKNEDSTVNKSTKAFDRLVPTRLTVPETVTVLPVGPFCTLVIFIVVRRTAPVQKCIKKGDVGE